MGKKGGTRHDCTPPLEQHSDTCYFNSAINGLLLSIPIQQICLRELKAFIQTLTPEQKYRLNEYDGYCIDPHVFESIIPTFESDQKVINYISLINVYGLFKAWFCYYEAMSHLDEATIAAQYIQGLRQSSRKKIEPITSILEKIKKMAVDGNFSLIVFDRIFRLLYKQSYKQKVEIISYDQFLQEKNLETVLQNREVICIHQYTQTHTIRETLEILFNLPFKQTKLNPISILNAMFDTEFDNFIKNTPGYTNSMKEKVFDLFMNIYTVFPRKNTFRTLFNTNINTFLNNYGKKQYTTANLIGDLIAQFKYKELLQKKCIYYTIPNRKVIDIQEINTRMKSFPQFELDHAILNLRNDIGGHSVLATKCNDHYQIIDPNDVTHPIFQSEANWSNGGLSDLQNNDSFKHLFEKIPFDIGYEYVCFVKKQDIHYKVHGCTYTNGTQFIYQKDFSTVTLNHPNEITILTTPLRVQHSKLGLIPVERKFLSPLFSIQEVLSEFPIDTKKHSLKSVRH